MSIRAFDVIIIGSGQAGTPLAFKMAGAGKQVAFIEKDKLGGTCVNVGCTPTKAYVASARRIWAAKNSAELGVVVPDGVKIDLPKVKARKDEIVKSSREGIRSGLENNDHIKFFEGEARFVDHKTVEVGGQRLQAEEIYINVGARPLVPKEYQQVDYLTNESILQLETLPKHLIIVGGSYIGLEFGQMFRRFGSEVTIVEMKDRLISREDEEISEYILNILKKENINVRLEATCLGGHQYEDGTLSVSVDCHQGEPEVHGSHLLLAVGRRPNTDRLNLEATGVKCDDRGYIQINDYLETNVKGIYALGDCNGKGAFTHTAYNDYEIIAANKFENRIRKVSDRILTYGLYIDPPLGRAGLTRQQAKEKNYKILEGKRPMKKIARAKEKGETEGLMHLVIDAENQQILGAAILGIGGDEIISSILNVMYARLPYTLIRDSVPPHPTVSELIPTTLENLKDEEE